MAYYKIAYESDTIEGLKAIQGGAVSRGAGTSDSSGSENSAPPPMQDKSSSDSSMMMQPPPIVSDASSSPDGGMQPPPPITANPGAMDIDDIPLPPMDE